MGDLILFLLVSAAAVTGFVVCRILDQERARKQLWRRREFFYEVLNPAMFFELDWSSGGVRGDTVIKDFSPKEIEEMFFRDF